MPFIRELFDSRDITVSADANSSDDRHYLVTESIDEWEVSALIEASIPAFANGLRFQNYKMTHKGGGVWDVTARYGARKQAEFSFDTTGGTQKLLQSKGTRSCVIPGAAITDMGGAINVAKDKVEGIDVAIPEFNFTLKYYIQPPLNPDFALALYEKTGTVNKDTIILEVNGLTYTFRPGELHYLGSNGSEHGIEDWEILLKFAASRNVENVEFAASPNTVYSGVATEGEMNIVGIDDTTGIVAGAHVFGLGIPPGAAVVTIDSGTEITMDDVAQFSGPVTFTAPSAANIISVGTKKGWDYLCVNYKDAESNNQLVKFPRQVDVHQIFDYASLAILFGQIEPPSPPEEEP